MLAHADKSASTLASLVSEDQTNSAARTSKNFKDELQTLLIPGPKPPSRVDAIMIDEWVSTNLARYVERSKNKAENLSQAVEEIVPVLSIALHEVVRQLTHECMERGIVLEKIWRTFVELFERVLRDVRSLLTLHKKKTRELQETLDSSKAEYERLKTKYPAQVQKVKRSLEHRFSIRQQELRDQLAYRDAENAALMEHLDSQRQDCQIWFPNFGFYKDSELRKQIGRTEGKKAERRKKDAQVDSSVVVSEDPAQAVSMDLARVLSMISAAERRLIGFYVSSMLGLTDKATAEEMTRKVTDQLNTAKDERAELTLQVRKLEREIASLRDDASGASGEDVAPRGETPEEQEDGGS